MLDGIVQAEWAVPSRLFRVDDDRENAWLAGREPRVAVGHLCAVAQDAEVAAAQQHGEDFAERSAGADAVEIDVVFEPAWSPALISEEGREILGIGT